MIPVLVIFAPTACGKTALAREIFGKSSLSPFKSKGEVISADSQAVYVGMNVGTAKPTKQELEDIPHHLVDIISPSKQFGVGEFINLADSACKDIWARGKLPIVLGGTGFYIRNFLLGLPVTPESDPLIRQKLKIELQEKGNLFLYNKLQQVDLQSAQRINCNDAYRICRALEVFYTTGKPLSSYKMPQNLRSGYNFCIIVLNRQKEDLYNRINNRVEQMFACGLKQEVDDLLSLGFTQETPGMKAIGYNEFFLPNLTLGQIKEKIKVNSRRYAKKQYTFMRGIPNAVTVEADDKQTFVNIINNFATLQNIL